MIVQADEGAIAQAARILREGGLVAFPTETVYGLGADATNGKAVARIYEAKRRPRFTPLIAHVENLAAARDLVEFNSAALALAERFWPGPLTLVLPLRAGARHTVSGLVTAGLGTLAVRVPAHPVALRLLAAAGVPVAAPSANLSGRVSPTNARHVEQDLGGAVDAILDGGATEAGVESTIASFAPAPTLLRPGGLAREEIEAVLGMRLQDYRAETIQAPGQLESHYAPRAQLTLNATQARAAEALLAFGPGYPEAVLNLSPGGDLREAAANLFAYLRELDARGPARIAVTPIPGNGLGEAINDRLARAAAPRPPLGKRTI